MNNFDLQCIQLSLTFLRPWWWCCKNWTCCVQKSWIWGKANEGGRSFSQWTQKKINELFPSISLLTLSPCLLYASLINFPLTVGSHCWYTETHFLSPDRYLCSLSSWGYILSPSPSLLVLLTHRNSGSHKLLPELPMNCLTCIISIINILISWCLSLAKSLCNKTSMRSYKPGEKRR